MPAKARSAALHDKFHPFGMARSTPLPGPVCYPEQEGTTLAPTVWSACIDGHGAEPYEQKTQQSPGLGLSRAPQPTHS
jgi:hypothetical protein